MLAEETAHRDPEEDSERRPPIVIVPASVVGAPSLRPEPTETNVATPAGSATPPRGTLRRAKLLVAMGLVLALAAAQGIRVLRSGTETTDNATVSARMVGISSEVAGTVREILVQEHERVEAGAVLMRLDTSTVRL